MARTDNSRHQQLHVTSKRLIPLEVLLQRQRLKQSAASTSQYVGQPGLKVTLPSYFIIDCHLAAACRLSITEDSAEDHYR